MRWGISDEATNNHMASHICINEIKNSQHASIGPNFVVLNSYLNTCYNDNNIELC